MGELALSEDVEFCVRLWSDTGVTKATPYTALLLIHVTITDGHKQSPFVDVSMVFTQMTLNLCSSCISYERALVHTIVRRSYLFVFIENLSP